jgi:hypothetical protein
VFSSVNPFPLPDPLASDSIPRIITLAQATLENRPTANGTSVTAAGSLLEDGSAADPCSLLPAVMLADRSVGNDQKIRGVGYADAAVAQIRYTLEDVPRVCLLQYTSPIQLMSRHLKVPSLIEQNKHSSGQTGTYSLFPFDSIDK